MAKNISRCFKLLTYILWHDDPLVDGNIIKKEFYRNEKSEKSAERMFERDKKDLRNIGINIECCARSDFSDGGYRINKEDIYLPKLSVSNNEKIALYWFAMKLAVEFGDPFKNTLKRTANKLILDIPRQDIKNGLQEFDIKFIFRLSPEKITEMRSKQLEYFEISKVSEKIEKILSFIQYVFNHQGLQLGELAEVFETTEKEILKDLNDIPLDDCRRHYLDDDVDSMAPSEEEVLGYSREWFRDERDWEPCIIYICKSKKVFVQICELFATPFNLTAVEAMSLILGIDIIKENHTGSEIELIKSAVKKIYKALPSSTRKEVRKVRKMISRRTD